MVPFELADKMTLIRQIVDLLAVSRYHRSTLFFDLHRESSPAFHCFILLLALVYGAFCFSASTFCLQELPFRSVINLLSSCASYLTALVIFRLPLSFRCSCRQWSVIRSSIRQDTEHRPLSLTPPAFRAQVSERADTHPYSQHNFCLNLTSNF